MSAKVVGIDVLRWRAFGRWKAKQHREYLLRKGQAATQEAARAQKTAPAPPPPAPPAKLLAFILAERPTAVRAAPRVLPFLTKQEFARRECERLWAAYESWVLRKWALPVGAPIEEPPCSDIMLCTMVERELRLRRLQRHVGETVLRTPAPHPVFRIVGWCRLLVGRLLDGLQIALLAYYALLGADGVSATRERALGRRRHDGDDWIILRVAAAGAMVGRTCARLTPRTGLPDALIICTVRWTRGALPHYSPAK